MTCKCALLCLLAVSAPGWAQSVIEGVEKRYNNVKSLEVQFEETVSYAGRNRREEKGTLYLLRPGKMRWEYTQPAGKLFVSDGKVFHLYSPNSNQVQRIRPKETDDMRAPLAFLLGRLDFRKEFGKIVTRSTEAGIELTAFPRTEREAFSQVVFTIVPKTFEMRRIVITGQDGMLTEFAFKDEVVNPPLQAKLFQFQAPPGARIVEGAQ